MRIVSISSAPRPSPRIDEALLALPVSATANDTAPIFLHSFGHSLIDQMPPVPDASDLYIAAPFRQQPQRPESAQLPPIPKGQAHIFPAVHSGRATDIPLKQLKTTHRGAVVSRLSAAPKNTAFAHLKLYGVAQGDNAGWLCCASADRTQAAWQGPDVEAGLLRQVSPQRSHPSFVPRPCKASRGVLSTAHLPSDSATVHCWASDPCAGIDLAVPSSSSRAMPWHEVTAYRQGGQRLRRLP